MPNVAALRFDPSQQEALDRILTTLASTRPGQFRLGGLAGSGKTTILRKAMTDAGVLGLDLAVASFTGKAVDVLRRKGIHQAQTLHSLMYHFDAETRTFHRKRSLGGDERIPRKVDGVIVDEASTVNKDLHDDLLSFKVPVVWVGDHGQLEPVGDNPNIMSKPDHVLERIYRQAEGSAILDVAHAFREGRVPDWKAGPEVERVLYNAAMERITEFDVVLCGKNATRHNVNRFVRRRKGFVLPVEAGETMVCLRNNRDHMVFNGMLLKVAAVHRPAGQDQVLDLEEVGTGRKILHVRCKLASADEDGNGLQFLPRTTIALDYGYALSVHKAQGSEFDRVMVVEERGGWDMRRWRYTAASRAAKHLAWTV